ncbi:MAG: tRNA lysidine(34) synthetase TilS, partial [Rhodospirillales bacterium]
MAATGPYEAAPHLAVAVSGGGDSLALALLVERWCRGRGGRVSALIVNHGLRPEAKEEAACVGGWIEARGIAHWILVWDGPKPISGLQAAARAARYDLMSAWCRTHGVLHLLVGHTREDQAETFLMRLEKGSGPDGLAAMSWVRALPFCRLVRPLLELTRAALRATLAAFGQAWIEDPSNNDR